MRSNDKISILFLENRSITDVWSGVAGVLANEFDCQLLRFNRAFGRNFPGKIVDLVMPPNSSVISDQEIDIFIQEVFRTDRSSYLYGANEADVRNAILAVFDSLEYINFEIVIGEVTSVYERAVEFYCKIKKIPFLAPMTSRIPLDRFFFLNGASLFPLPIPGEFANISGIEKAQFNAGLNDLVIDSNRYVRFYNSVKTIAGWILGERLHTPSPFRRIILGCKIKYAKFCLSRMDFAKIEDVKRTSVIYCMHVQPESTLDTYSPKFWDQFEVVKEIFNACEEAKRPFFLRLHPRGRSELSLYLSKIKGLPVKILSPNISMHELLQHKPTIITVSGTVLLEAASAGAEAIALDCTYISSFPGVKQVPINGLIDVLSSDTLLPTVLLKNQRKWFDSINKFSHKGLIAPPEWSGYVLSNQNLSDISIGVRLAIDYMRLGK